MRIRYLVLPVLFAGSLVACGDDDDDTTGTDAPIATEAETEESMTGDASMATDAVGTDIVDTAVAAGSFATLVTAVQAAELEETLRGDGPFTVFAPTDDAFAALPAGTLDTLLADPTGDLAASSPTTSSRVRSWPTTSSAWTAKR
jgi:Fasciclin domain